MGNVGDGVTDLAARSSGAYVVGFGGVAHRKVMAEGADAFVADESDGLGDVPDPLAIDVGDDVTATKSP